MESQQLVARASEQQPPSPALTRVAASPYFFLTTFLISVDALTCLLQIVPALNRSPLGPRRCGRGSASSVSPRFDDRWHGTRPVTRRAGNRNTDGVIARTCTAEAATLGQEIEQRVHRPVLGAVADESTLGLTDDESGMSEFLQVKRKRGTGNVEPGGNQAGGHPSGSCLDEEPVDAEAGCLSEGGQRIHRIRRIH